MSAFSSFKYRTPHESLEVSEKTYRQFFRLVTSKVSLWYKSHSTENPLGVRPDPTVTKIVVGDKFSDDGVRIVEEEEVASNEAAADLPDLSENKKKRKEED